MIKTQLRLCLPSLILSPKQIPQHLITLVAFTHYLRISHNDTPPHNKFPPPSLLPPFSPFPTLDISCSPPPHPSNRQPTLILTVTTKTTTTRNPTSRPPPTNLPPSHLFFFPLQSQSPKQQQNDTNMEHLRLVRRLYPAFSTIRTPFRTPKGRTIPRRRHNLPPQKHPLQSRNPVLQMRHLRLGQRRCSRGMYLG